MSNSKEQISVLIVCLGNICRSPMGEAVLSHVAKARGHDITVDSCGTGAYHTGEDPDDSKVSTVFVKHQVPISHAARKVQKSDFTNFTHILAADQNNLRDLQRMAPGNATAEIKLSLLGGINGFERVYQQCVKLSHAFLDDVFGSQA
ncbi:phosphotyrosine protein phosphatase [Hymenopellis radicata]|nr:phosphotyrosine protein phosphatase [Hymenopellis radicata]